MAKPKCPQLAPYKENLEAGKYWWCACGSSEKQPFCDGSHKGSEFTPVPFEVKEKKDYWLCGCKMTDNKPFCDGTHKSFM